MAFDSNNDMLWRAACYVAGDMSDADRSAFEAQLAVNQAAREAVAEAVALMTALNACRVERVSPAHGTSGSRRRIAAGVAALVGALAGCIAVVWLGWVGWRGGSDLDGTDRGSSGARSESVVHQLAVAWADLSDAAWQEQTSDVAAEPDFALPVAPTAEESARDDEAVAAPDWLLAALDDQSEMDSDETDDG